MGSTYTSGDGHYADGSLFTLSVTGAHGMAYCRAHINPYLGTELPSYDGN